MTRYADPNRLILKRNNPMLTEAAPHRFVIDASDLRLCPGVFPDHIYTDMGNGNAFRRTGFVSGGAVYAQIYGCLQLTVGND